MHGRVAFRGSAFLLWLLLHLVWRLALAPAPAEEEGGACTADDETSRLRCQLHAARALIEAKDAELARKEKENSIEFDRKEALIKEKDAELARRAAVLKDMEAQLARKEAQDKPPAMRDAMIKDEAPAVKDVMVEDNTRAWMDAMVQDNASAWEDGMFQDEAPAVKDTMIEDNTRAWMDGMFQDMEGHLGRQHVQDNARVLKDAMIEDNARAWEDAMFQDNASAWEDAMFQADDHDLWRRRHRSRHGVPQDIERLTYRFGKRRVPIESWQEQRKYPDPWRRSHLSKYMIEQDEDEYPDLRRHGRLSKHRRLDAEQDLLEQILAYTTYLPTIIAALPDNMTAISLIVREIRGPLPADIGRLVHLEILELGGNIISGTLPAELGSLVNLKYLDLAANALHGTIPPELGNLTKLVKLDLNMNGFTGTIPPELGNLTQLAYMNLANNNGLGGQLPGELGRLSQLKVLDFAANPLTGTIPPELGNLMQLEELVMVQTSLTGTIPPEVGNLTKLTWLDLNTNLLEGTIPPELGNLTQLYWLDLSTNLLEGNMPPVGKLVQLTYMDVSRISLRGTMPPELGKLVQLTHLDVSRTSLGGTMPPGLGNLIQLTFLDVSRTSLRGTMPPELGNLVQLTFMDMSRASLRGTIPPELGHLTQLTRLLLNDNALTGTIPNELGNLTQLYDLDLSSNGLTGTVPHGLGSAQPWQKLSFAGNDLTGTLPEGIGQSQALVYLDVSDNPGLTGTFPDTTNTKLPEILASHCNFTSAGAVAPTVRKIFFAHNHLTEFPEEWVNLPLVLELDVSFNHIGVWRPRGVLYAFLIAVCGIGPMAPRFEWPAIQSVKLSGNPFGLSITLRDFLWSLAYVTSLSELFAAGCLLHGVFPNSVGGIGTEDDNTGPCDNNGNDAYWITGFSQGFRGLLTLDLSDNDITAILPPPPPRLYTADLHSNLLEQLHGGWYSTPRIVKVWNNSLLRANVTPPSRATRCPTGGTPSMEADPFGFITTAGEDAFECTTLCVSVTSRYEHDASLNISSLCRCTAGRWGAANNCSGCPADTYSHYDAKDKLAMVRNCRPCPERSSTENVKNATAVDQCKCQAGWYMQTPSTGDPTPACKRCSQGVFMDTPQGATQEEQCFCNTSYDGLRALQGHCGCADGSYMDNLALACRQCDAVAEECTWGSTIELSLLPPVIKPSYWAAQPPEVGPEEVSTFSRHDIWRCYSKDTCLRNGTCAVGRSGTACSLCGEGMYGGPDGPCTACPYNPEEARKNLCYALLIGPAATIAAHTLLSFNAGKLASSFATLRTSGKQSLKYLQMLGVMAGFNIDWPPLPSQFITSVARITVALPQVAGVACLTGRQTATLEMGFRWLMPVAGLLSAGLGPVVLAPIRVCFRKSRFYALVRMSYWDVLRVSLWGLVLFYSTLLQFGTQVLACVPSPNGMRTVATFPHLQCGANREWTQLAGVSVAFLLLFVGAVFLSIYAAWRRATHALVESKFESSGWWGFIFDDYRGGSEYWLMVTMAKDAALVVIATAGASDGPSQLLATAAVSTMYSYVVLRDQPFRDTSNSVLEAWTMMSVAVISVFTAGMGFQSASGVADVTELFSDGAADPEYKKRERALLVVQCLTFVGPAGIILYQLLCALDKVKKRLPACLRPSTKEEREEWNARFLTSVNLDEATAPVLWGVVDHFDMVDNARFRDLMTTSMATLNIIPNNARGISIKRMVRKRLINIASASEHRKVLEPAAPLPPPPADLAEDGPHGPGAASIGTDLVATLDVPAALFGDSGGAHAPKMLLADGHAGRMEYL